MRTDLFFRAVDKARLIEFIGGLPEALRVRVKAALKLLCGIWEK